MSTANQPNTFAEANVALNAKLLSAVQAAIAAAGGSTAAAAATANNNNSNNGGGSIFAPTPLLVRVLRRTAVDFADVIVDGRCATGSRQVGSAAAVWVHHNAAARSGGAGGGNSTHSSPATVTATGAAAGGASSPPTNGVAAPNNNNNNSNGNNGAGAITPLYHTDAALSECRQLLALYSLHCLLTATQAHNASTSKSSQHVHAAADGRVRQLPSNASPWAPEVAIVVAETEATAEELLRLCRLLAEACNCGVQVSLALGSKAPASLIVRPASASSTAASSSNGKDADAGGSGSPKKEEVKKKGTEWPTAASVIVTTTHSILNWNLTTLLNNGVDVAIAEEADEAEANKEKEKEKDAVVRTKRVYPHIASLVVEEIARATASTSASGEKAIQQWRDVHAALTGTMTRLHPRYSAAAHLLPHFLWICRGPVSRLPASMRQLLSRRSRRYYQLLPSTYISSAASALMPQPQEGLSTPAESLGIRLVLSQSIVDKDAQLRRIVTDRSGLYHRVLILTHNKEVPQLNTLITSWGVTREYPGSVNSPTAASSSAQSAITTASPNLVHSTRRMDSLVAQHQCHMSYLNSCEAAERATAPANAAAGPSDEAASSSSSSSSPVVVTLAAWDAFTALDVMDVDVIVQYYPPQKSLTEQEWAEFIQLLHTTVDGEREIELSLRQNRNNKETNIRAKLGQLMQSTTTRADPAEAKSTVASSSSTSSPAPAKSSPHRPLPVLVTLMIAADFTLTAYFLHQYLYSGGSGTLTAAATATSLASTVPAPGKPGVQEAVEHPVPVLDISPKHPYFIPLVCGHDGGAEWPENAPGSPPKPRVTRPDYLSTEAPLLTHFTSGEAVNIRNVLEVKLAKEQNRSDAPKSVQGSSAGASPTTTGAAASPVMLLAQGNTSMGGSGSNAPVTAAIVGGVKGAGRSGSSDGGNIARLMRNATNAAGGGGGANNNTNNGGIVLGGGASGHSSPGARDAAGSLAEANTSSTSAAGSGGKGSNNTAKPSNNNNRGNKGGASGVGNANGSATTSSFVPPAAASAAAAAGGATGGSGAPADGSNSTPTPTATTPSSRTANGDKSGGNSNSNNNRRRVRNGRGANANGSNGNNNGGNNNSKKAAA